MSKVHNYSAGPCILPQEVFEQASKSIENFNDLNLSLIEISHRSKDFVKVMPTDYKAVLLKRKENKDNNKEVVYNG